VVEPRRIGMLLCHELLRLSLREIGAAFGDRDSSTVLSALARAREDLEESGAVAERVARLRQMLPRRRIPTLRGCRALSYGVQSAMKRFVSSASPRGDSMPTRRGVRRD
jgi:hypothetical protein